MEKVCDEQDFSILECAPNAQIGRAERIKTDYSSRLEQ